MDENTTPAQSSSPMKFIIPVVLLLIVGVGVFFMMQANKSAAPATTQPETTTQSTGETVTDPQTGGDAAMQEPVIVSVNADNFAFDVKEIKAKVGQTVTINFTNKEGMHDWVIDEFNARTQVLEAGGTETITFVVDKAGTYEYYCSVMQHRQMGMVGKLIVE